jgi:hypothetical protein
MGFKAGLDKLTSVLWYQSETRIDECIQHHNAACPELIPFKDRKYIHLQAFPVQQLESIPEPIPQQSNDPRLLFTARFP